MTRLHPKTYRDLVVELPLTVLFFSTLAAGIAIPLLPPVAAAFATGVAAAITAVVHVRAKFEPNTEVDESAETMRAFAKRSRQISQGE